MKIRSKRFLPFSVIESSWPPSTLPCSHLQICKWREGNGAACICIAHQKIRQCLCSHRFAAVLPFCWVFLIQLNSTMCFSCIFEKKESVSTWEILVSLWQPESFDIYRVCRMQKSKERWEWSPGREFQRASSTLAI